MTFFNSPFKSNPFFERNLKFGKVGLAMFLVPLLYLKNKNAVRPSETNPAWFVEDPVALANYFHSQGAEKFYLNDLNVPAAGKSENVPMAHDIRKNAGLQVWVTGAFRSVAAMEPYVEIGVEKIVLGASAYQNPAFLKEAIRKFPGTVAVLIEVKNGHVVVPGMAVPTHKTALDYAKRFEEEGVCALFYSDTHLSGVKEFCAHVRTPVVGLCDVQNRQDLEQLFACEPAGLSAVVLGKTLYENHVDLHGGIAFLNDLAAQSSQETTITPD